MIPGAFVTLDAWPLTPNGKVDRRALPDADGDALVSRPFAAPQGEVETRLARMWEVLLGVAQVGRDDHFFELGGHSLLAIQLLARVRQEFGVGLDLNHVFQTPTVAAMAQIIATLVVAQFESDDVARLSADLDAMSEDELMALLEQERKLAAS
ncbi:phosphopantetheine-binding protein [Massilia sp. B-10]|nr:phosphopantetheine-binding protein [Massilia sp. B-10]UUZ56133.1 phosphopantetheine-binding protein [Massilia sp. H-1]